MGADLSPRKLLEAPGLLEALNRHAMSWFPKESCALLVSSPAGPEVVLAENLADRYHTLDPESYPRTAERAYVLNPLLIQRTEEAGKRLVAIVHSHVAVGAYFSDEDVRQALSPFGDGPLYPGVAYVVLDAQEGGVRGFKVFGWDDAQAAFVEG
jgi:proteasome lid subunit RPN8/RPN11